MGSRALVWAAVAHPDAGAPLHGHYIHCCRVEEESDYSLSEEGEKVQERLWVSMIISDHVYNADSFINVEGDRGGSDESRPSGRDHRQGTAGGN